MGAQLKGHPKCSHWENSSMQCVTNKNECTEFQVEQNIEVVSGGSTTEILVRSPTIITRSGNACSGPSGSSGCACGGCADALSKPTAGKGTMLALLATSLPRKPPPLRSAGGRLCLWVIRAIVTITRCELWLCFFPCLCLSLPVF